MGRKQIDMISAVLRGMILETGLTDVLTGLANALCHGEVLREAYGRVTQDELDSIFPALEAMQKASMANWGSGL